MIRTHILRRVAIAVGSAAVVLLGFVATALAVSGQVEGLITVCVIGGAVIALVLIGANATRRPSVAEPDPFSRDVFSQDTINIAHIRVAGVGGLALLVVSFVVTLQFQLLTAALVASMLGGLLCGVLLILFRRARRHS